MGAGFDTERARWLHGVLTPERLTRIVDVGANPINSNPYSGLLSAGLCDVWGFEPQEDAYVKLVASAGPHEHYLPNAVGDGGEAELKVCKNDGFTSLLEPRVETFEAIGKFKRAVRVIDRVKVQTATLDSLEALPEFDMLKIDVQGGEQEVFKGATRHLSHVLAVITEVAAIPLYEGQPLLEDQCRSLRDAGLELHKFLHFVTVPYVNEFSLRMPRRIYRSQYVDGDAVFVRAILAPGTLSSEALKHSAILADAVYDSQDVAVFFMMELVQRGEITADDLHGYIDHLPETEPHVREPA